jgi:hypothetical protein
MSIPIRFEILEGGSRWMPEQAPDAVASLLLDHLSAYEGDYEDVFVFH